MSKGRRGQAAAWEASARAAMAATLEALGAAIDSQLAAADVVRDEGGTVEERRRCRLALDATDKVVEASIAVADLILAVERKGG
jgi:hypothetical protein